MWTRHINRVAMDGNIIMSNGRWPKNLLVIFCIVAWLDHCVTWGMMAEERSKLEETLVEKVSNLPSILKSTRPYRKSGGPPNVEVGMFLQSISNINSAEQTFDVDLVLKHRWRDPRLNFTEQANTSYTLAINNKNLISKIWIPDLYFSNAISTIHQNRVDSKNLAEILRIYPGGIIQYTNRLKLQIFCSMNLKKFPADRQNCKLAIESYGDTVDLTNLLWEKDTDCPVTLMTAYNSPQFMIPNSCPKLGITYTYYDIRKFVALEVYIELQRRMTSFIFTVYVPAAMIVLLSMVSLWIRPGSVPARVALGITTVLSEATVMSGSINAHPTVSYLKALDLYTMVCFCYTFASLIEFAIVHKINRTKYFSQIQLSHQKGEVDDGEDGGDDDDDVPPADIRTKQGNRNNAPSPKSPKSPNSPKLCPNTTNGNGFYLENISSRSTRVIFDPENVTPDAGHNQNCRKRWKLEKTKMPELNERQLLIDYISPLDSASRVLFPFTFVFFNVLYFLWILDYF